MVTVGTSDEDQGKANWVDCRRVASRALRMEHNASGAGPVVNISAWHGACGGANVA